MSSIKIYNMIPIDLKERGTIAVMQWIADNNTPSLYCRVFAHQGKEFMIVSDQSNMEAILMLHPLETWHEINGMKRIMVSEKGSEPRWYFYINEKFYFATLY